MALPTIAVSAAGDIAATSATVWMPRSCNFADVIAPTPHSRCTGRGCRKSSSPSGSTTSSPSGLPTALATFARNLVRATPTLIGSPTSVATRARSRVAISTGVPAIRQSPPTSMNASSIDIGSTTGEMSRKMSKTARLAAV